MIALSMKQIEERMKEMKASLGSDQQMGINDDALSVSDATLRNQAIRSLTNEIAAQREVARAAEEAAEGPSGLTNLGKTLEKIVDGPSPTVVWDRRVRTDGMSEDDDHNFLMGL